MTVGEPMYAKVEKKAVVVKEVREGGREGASERERERERERRRRWWSRS